MAERLNTFTVPSPEVQGAGSSVTFRRMTYAEWREFKAWPSGPDVDPAEDEARGRQWLRERVVTWDWVDNVGALLPTPAVDPDVLDRLTIPERDFLIGNAAGTAQAKNSVGDS
jgi:hypothetical protein